MRRTASSRLPVAAKTLLLCLLLLASPALLAPLDLPSPRPGLPHLPFVVLTALFLLGGLLLFHFEFREEAHSFTLTEVPLVLGLFLADPHELVAARLLGEVLALVLLPRQPWLKCSLNTTLYLAETCTALAVVALLTTPDPDRPSSWLAVGLAVLVADLLSNAVVHVVIRWHGAKPQLRTVAASAAATAVVNTCLGLVAVLLIQVHIASVVVLVIIAGVLAAGYRGYGDLQQRYASLRLLHDFSEAIGGVTRPEDVIEAMLHHARRLLRADVAELVVLPYDDRPDLRVTLRGTSPVAHGTTGQDLSLLREVVASGRSRVHGRGGRDEGLTDYLSRLGCLDAVVVPVVLSDGTSLVLTVGERLANVSTFDDEDQRLFETLASHAGMALEKGRLIDELRGEAARREHQALHDHLTGLPNRLHFSERAAQMIVTARADGHRLATLLLDLDGFKDVNDTLGHHTGDELLQEIGRRLRAVVRPGDVAARLGGDEFAVMLDLGEQRHTSAEDARETAFRVLEQLEGAVQLDGMSLDVRASVGVAAWPDHAEDPATLLQRADVAMYEAKRSRSRVALYDADRDHHTPWRLQLATELRRAIDEQQLLVHYQPKADLLTGRITGAEALVRWQHPEHGRIGPDDFIPVAEQTGLITALTYVVLETSLADCASWRRSGLDVGVAVNVSVRSLLEADFVDRVLALLGRSTVPPVLLTLELTESSIMGDTHRTLDVLNRLASAGVRLSVDDFGTGYSSLSYLQRLPVRELKVDRSFVFDVARSASDQAIVQSVVDLGRSLGLSVVAEGVENQLTWDVLTEMGCDTGQGYFLSPALPAAEMHRWMHRRQVGALAPARSAV